MKDRWLAICEANAQGGAETEWERIQNGYATPLRSYHNLEHVAACLDSLDRYRDLADDPVSVEFALWYHDVVYDTHAGDNEAASAEFAGSFLGKPVNVRRVEELILATKHDKPAAEGDEALICDIDLAILGAKPESYAEYGSRIREEYGWVPDAEYRSGREKVLRSFLERETIYRVPDFRDRFEEQARENLETEIRELES